MSELQVNRRQVLIATGALAATPPRLLLADSPVQRVVRTRTECIDSVGLTLEVGSGHYDFIQGSQS